MLLTKMPNLFRKLDKGASRFFSKVGKGANRFFTKTIPDAAHSVGDGLNQAGGEIGGFAKKVGSALEKAAPILSDIGAGIATALGQPEVGIALAAAGNSAGAIGKASKRIGNSVQQSSAAANSALNAKASQFGSIANNFAQNKLNNIASTVATVNNAGGGMVDNINKGLRDFDNLTAPKTAFGTS